MHGNRWMESHLKHLTFLCVCLDCSIEIMAQSLNGAAWVNLSSKWTHFHNVFSASWALKKKKNDAFTDHIHCLKPTLALRPDLGLLQWFFQLSLGGLWLLHICPHAYTFSFSLLESHTLLYFSSASITVLPLQLRATGWSVVHSGYLWTPIGYSLSCLRQYRCQSKPPEWETAECCKMHLYIAVMWESVHCPRLNKQR